VGGVPETEGVTDFVREDGDVFADVEPRDDDAAIRSPGDGLAGSVRRPRLGAASVFATRHGGDKDIELRFR